jgi:hypothetical protein
MNKNLTSALVLAGCLGLAAALPASATEDNSAEITRLESESARYSELAKAEAKRQKHHSLAAAGSVKGGQQARAAYHERLAAEYQAKSELYATEAQQLRDATKRVAQN